MTKKILQKPHQKHAMVYLLNYVAVKRTYALWFGPTLRQERRTLLPCDRDGKESPS
jgi:hypothetical protein